MPFVPLARAPYERKSIDIPTWDQWLTKLVTAVNDIATGGGTYDAGNLTGTTLAPNVIFSSLTTVGTLVGGATGAGFTINLAASTVTGDLSYSNLAQGSALSVLGVTGNATADNASIVAASDFQVLRRSGTAVSFGAVNLASSAAVTGTLADGNLSSNVPLKNGTNAFTGANSFATNPLDLLVGQLAFPATANPSSNVNTLDEYEEGTWTPADGSGAGLALTSVIGTYIKIGKLVHASYVLIYPATASGAAAIISGLPFTSASPGNTIYGGMPTLTIGIAPVTTVMVMPQGTTTFGWNNKSTGGAVTNAQVSGTVFTGTLVYQAAT